MPSYVMHLAVAKLYLSCHTGENKSARGLMTSYDRGYFLHLKTDLLFYRELITPEQFSEEIYEDYNRMNGSLMQKCELEIPEEIRKYVKFREDETVKLHEYMAIDFINTVGKLELEETAGDGEIPYRIGRNVFWRYENLDEYHLEDNIGVAGELLTKSYIPIVASQLYKRYPGQWIPKVVIANCINALYEYKEKMDISHLDDQIYYYKSHITKLTDDVCIRHTMEEKENETKRSDTGRSY